MNYKGNVLIIGCLLIVVFADAQLMVPKFSFTYADTLRGSITPYRQGWDVIKYELEVEPDLAKSNIEGKNTITFLATSPLQTIQIDLQQPLIVDSITGPAFNKYSFVHTGNVCLVDVKLPAPSTSGGCQNQLTVYYHGKPKKAINPPWDGGLIWRKDANGNPFIATACQGLGASVWWPCKDHQSDEPDSGMVIKIIAPDGLSAISNGRLMGISILENKKKLWTWQVKDPINSYGVTMNIGRYRNFSDTLLGEAGKLDLNYWVLEYNLDKATSHFKQAKNMLRSFEYWFGPYPFYADGYKLVETPFLGMEHQSAIAYGNNYQNGYSGKDLSFTGWGLKWDFMIVHESGHEWFGNNITTKDIADMWVHEGFTNYSETLFTESEYGVKAANQYNVGTRKNIENNIPIIGPYGVNKEGSGDMYYKGGNMLQLIRHSINNDVLFRKILRGLNMTFYHQTVTSKQVEEYISTESKIDFSTVFSQYLRTIEIPVLEYYLLKNKTLYYRWNNCVEGFNLQLPLQNDGTATTLLPLTRWQKINFTPTLKKIWSVTDIQKNFYIQIKKVAALPTL